jgi:hypothetical protein
MNHSVFFRVLCSCMVASSILQAAAAPRPNIVLVVADDMGYVPSVGISAVCAANP